MIERRGRKIETFTDLRTWREGHKLVLMVYEVTKGFPRDEQFGLITQMRRSAASITSNVAEGFSRQSYNEKVQFYSIAQGSLTELQNQLFIARDVGYISKEAFARIAFQAEQSHKLINALIKKSKTFRNS